MSRLYPSEDVYCPTCEGVRRQERGRERGTRLCLCCGRTFTLKESRIAAANDAQWIKIQEKIYRVKQRRMMNK